MKMIEVDKNPWITKSSQLIYDNSWIEVKHHEVVTPGGSDGIYGVVHFKNLALAIIPIDDEGYTWLVGQYRYTLDEYSWEIPMGGGPLDQDPLISAQNELQEETGIIAQDWSCIMKLHTSNSITDEVGYVFIARNLKLGDSNWDDTEQLKIRKLKLEEAYDMVMDGKITDAISVAGLLKCKILSESAAR